MMTFYLLEIGKRQIMAMSNGIPVSELVLKVSKNLLAKDKIPRWTSSVPCHARLQMNAAVDVNGTR
jgi:hypothetical protein